MQILFLIIILSLLLLFFTYLYFYFYRLLNLLSIEEKKQKILALSITVLCIIPLLLRNQLAMFVIVLLLFSCLIVDGMNLLFTKLPMFYKLWNVIYMKGFLSFVLTVFLLFYGYYNATHVVITNYNITTTKHLENNFLKIAMISDLHAGTTMSLDKFQTYCDSISQQKPDLVICAGDIFDENTTLFQIESICKSISSISSTYGTFYIYGNHDSGTFLSTPQYANTDIITNLQKNNITILEDQAVMVNNSFYIIGRKDAYSRDGSSRKTINSFLSTLDTSKFMLLLDHQPRELKTAAALGIDLQLSGHTHGGQLWPIGILSELFHINEMNYGYRAIDDYQIIVSSGIGGWNYPIRTEKHAEIVIITINSESP